MHSQIVRLTVAILIAAAVNAVAACDSSEPVAVGAAVPTAANVAYLKQMLARKDVPRTAARGKPPVVAQDLSD